MTYHSCLFRWSPLAAFKLLKVEMTFVSITILRMLGYIRIWAKSLTACHLIRWGVEVAAYLCTGCSWCSVLYVKYSTHGAFKFTTQSCTCFTYNPVLRSLVLSILWWTSTLKWRMTTKLISWCYICGQKTKQTGTR